MSGAMTGSGAARLEQILERLRAVGEGAGPLSTPPRQELDAILDALWEEFAPHEADERRMALRLGGSAPELVRLAQRHLHRHLALLATEVRAEVRDALHLVRLSREIGAVEALVEAQLETERWMAHHQPRFAAPDPSHCRWCGAPVDAPGAGPL